MKTTEDVHGCSEEAHAEGCCERKECCQAQATLAQGRCAEHWREQLKGKEKKFRVFILKGICCSIKNVIHFQVVFYLVKKNMKATCFVVFSHLLTFFFSQSTSCDFASFSSARAPHTTRVANVWTRCMRRSLESWYRCKIHHRRSHFASYR